MEIDTKPVVIGSKARVAKVTRTTSDLNGKHDSKVISPSEQAD